MSRDLRVYLWDLKKALAEIEGFAAGKSFDDYLKERMLQRAIERDFITVGEILSRILHHFPDTKDRIDHARAIANFRNILVHDYDRIQDAVVWQIITVSVPILKQQIDAWAAELDSGTAV
jgi:uncharacterized protein with HEPN domain